MVSAYFEPYDAHSARRVGAAIISLFAISLFVGTLAVPVADDLTITVAFICPVVLLASAALLFKADAFVTRILCAFPLFGVVMIFVLNVSTRHASAGSQVALCAPVMFAASQLRPVGAVLILVSALVAEAAQVLLILGNPQDAISDITYVGTTMVAISLLLIFAARRQNRLMEQLETRAAVDPLTGLVTRRVLEDVVESALHGAARRAATGAGTGAGTEVGTALVLVDIDHFKTVNDTYGHPVGDDALTHVAAILVSLVQHDAVVGRLGGDELAVLLPGCDPASAVAAAQAFVDGVQGRPLIIDGQEPVQLSISAGVGYAAGDGPGLRQLYAVADASLYDAKRNGRGRVGRLDLGPVDDEDLHLPRSHRDQDRAKRA